MARQPGSYAIFNTSEGTIVCRLFEKEAPKTVANFVELAEGKREWTHPVSRKKSKDRLYDGTIFHRVIPNFMIQGGDPAGTGFGGPGYQFEDETKGSPHKFDKPGKLAMANAGPNTNGSQFFITVAPTQWLTGNHQRTCPRDIVCGGKEERLRRSLFRCLTTVSWFVALGFTTLKISTSKSCTTLLRW